VARPLSPRGHAKPSGYLSEDTISALASPVGGAVAIVRVSGGDALGVLRRLAPGLDPNRTAPWQLSRQRLLDEKDEALDDALVVYFRAPKSYTGEDSAELQIHGGARVAQRVLETLRIAGARQALPGEFSFRAVRNGKMTVSQAEAVSDLIAAENDAALGLALEKMSGLQSKLVATLADGLRQLATLVEIGIDFSDQDVDEVSLPRLKERIHPIVLRLRELEKSFDRGMRIQEGVSVAFVGLPNAGKSSAFNALLGEDRSIVSEVAGTTRDVVREKLTLQGRSTSVTLRLEDTAGLRESSDQVERIGIARSLKAARSADLVLLIVDATSSAEELKALAGHWRDLGAPSERTVGIVTKGDLGSAPSGTALFGQIPWCLTSARTGEGVSEAAARIADFCEGWVRRDRGEVVLTRLEHLHAVRDALTHLDRASQATEIDLFASDLKQSLHALAPLIGDTVPDDILGRVFSQFCIGK